MRRRRDDEWLDEARRKDRGGVARQFRTRQAQLTHGRVTRALLAGIIILLIVIVYSLQNPVTPAAPATPAASVDSASKTRAWAGVESWLASKPVGDDARIITWNGTRTISLQDADKTVRAHADAFTVHSSKGWWRVTITTRDDGQAAAWPTVERLDVPAMDTMGTSDEWPDTLGALSASDALTTLIDQWGRALMGSDSQLLTVVVKDPNPNHRYEAQRLGSPQSVTIERAAYLNQGSVDPEGNGSDRAVVRVTIQLSDSATVSYDVKVADPDGAPRILAWGPAGMGPGLADYSNRR